MLNQKALELLDFVSDGKVRYPGYNAELFGDNVQVETKEEAEDRVYRFVTEEASSKLLLEYAKSIKGSGNPESEIKTHPAYYLKTHPIYYSGDACRYSESMKKECDEVIASVVQKLINKIPDFAAELNQKALELLDFVPNEKVRYPGYNADLFGDNVQVETKEEAEDRVYRFVTEEASSKLLLEYAKSIKGSGNPESEIKTHPAYYLKTHPIYYSGDACRYSESMKKECDEVIASVVQKLINKIPDFAAELNQKALELLDFVPNEKVRYPGYNADLFGDNVQVETKEEAEDRVYKFITEEASSKLLLEYAKSIKGSGNPESEIKTHPAYYLKTYPIYYRDTFRYSESMKKECTEVIKSVTQKLINKIPDFATEASKETNATKKREIEEKKAEQKKEYNDYISCVSAKRAQLTQEAKDAGFESLLEYLMFLEIYETCGTNVSAGYSLANTFKRRETVIK